MGLPKEQGAKQLKRAPQIGIVAKGILSNDLTANWLPELAVAGPRISAIAFSVSGCH